MKRTLSMLALAVLTIGLLGSCAKINERLDDLEKKVDGLENEKIASIDSQVRSIESSISDLESIRDKVQAMSDPATGLSKRIDELKAFVNDELKNYTTKEELLDGTLLTMEEYEKTCGTVAKIAAKVEGFDSDIKACADSLKGWVNEKFGGYYDIATIEAKLADLQAQIDTVAPDVDSLRAELAKTREEIDTAKAAISAEYRAVIETAIKTSEGKLTQALQDSIDSVNATIGTLTGRVDDLEMAVAILTGKVSDLENMIQTVTIVPAYADGSVRLIGSIVEVNIIVSPASAVKVLEKDSVSILLNTTITKAMSFDTVKTEKITDFDVDTARGTVEIKADISDKIPSEASLTLTVAVNVRNGISNYNTEFVTVAEGRGDDYYVSQDGSGSGISEDKSMSITKLKELLTPREEAKIPAQAAALNGATIHLGEGVYDLNDLLTMDYEGRKVKIDFVGEDTTTTVITGNEEHRLFVIGSGVSVSFDKITFRNSLSNNSTEPGILLKEGSESRFTECLIADNVNKDSTLVGKYHSQAGIKTYGKSYFEKCEFARNKASFGASLTIDADATVKDCIFHNNEGINGPGNSLYVDANCTVNVEGCKFEDNKTSEMDGGAVAVSAGRLNMTNCTFTGNSNSGWRGGALYAWNNAKVTLTGCQMTKNTSRNGGAIFTQNNSELEIVGGNFGCEAPIVGGTFRSGDGGDGNSAVEGGGFLYQGGNSKVTIKENAAIKNNCASEGYGSAIVMGSDEGFLTCENVTFENNTNKSTGGTSPYGGAVATTGKGMITMKDCLFKGNIDSCFGGAAINMTGSGDALISGCLFEGNVSKSTGLEEKSDNGRYGGGAIRFDSTGDISVDSCAFVGNKVGTEAPAGYNHAYGGAVYINAKGTYKFNGCKFKDNFAVRGGAFCAWATGATIYMNACGFDGDHTSFCNGTTIHIEKAKDFCMNNCSINDNTWTLDEQKDWRSSWVNLSTINNICLSNCSFMGSPKFDNGSGEIAVSIKQAAIVRFDDIKDGSHYFVNNIVVTENENGCNKSFVNYNTDNQAYHTKRSDNNKLNAGGTWSAIEDPASNGFKKEHFGDLAWNSIDMCWTWNGTMTDGNNTNKADAATAVSYISEIEGFKTWLEQIGALYKDQLGNSRPETGEWWPGAYQGSQPQ